MEPGTDTNRRALSALWNPDSRKLAALGWHFVACLFFAETGLAGRFVPAQALAAVAIAFVVATTLCWQWRLFGDPRRPLDLAGHLAFFASLFFLVSRLYVKNPASATLLDRLSDFARSGAGWLGGIPPQIFDAISSPGVALLFLAVCLALALPRALALGALGGIFALTLALTVTAPAFTAPGTLLCGVLALGAALCLQHDDAGERAYWTRFLALCEHDPAVRGDLELKMRLLRRLRDEGRPLTEGECLGTVATALACEPEDVRARTALARVASQLVRRDALGALYDGPDGKALALRPNPRPPDAFAHLANFPKLVVIALLAVVWILSPIDLIPDSTPLVGNLDDIAVALLSSVIAWRNLRRTPGDPVRSGVF
jgi:hypothetical protein